jgi:hypothetical protein
MRWWMTGATATTHAYYSILRIVACICLLLLYLHINNTGQLPFYHQYDNEPSTSRLVQKFGILFGVTYRYTTVGSTEQNPRGLFRLFSSPGCPSNPPVPDCAQGSANLLLPPPPSLTGTDREQSASSPLAVGDHGDLVLGIDPLFLLGYSC